MVNIYPHMDLIGDIVTIFRKDWKLLAAVNAFYLGVFLIGAVIALLRPDVQGYWLDVLAQGLKAGPLAPVGSAIAVGRVVNLAVSIFATNLITGTFVFITVPSLLFPPWALLLGGWRALLWGVAFGVPYGHLTMDKLVFHYVTMLVEGEAYVIAIFGSLRQALALIRPGRFGEASRLRAYLAAIVDNVKLLLVVVVLLAVGAVYEAFEVLYILR